MYDLVVLGNGSDGRRLAAAAARFGAKTALIEPAMGGDQTDSVGLVAQALAEAARLAHAIRTAGSFGLRAVPPEVDFPAVMARVRAVVDECAGRVGGDALRALGVAVYQGSASFEAYDTVLLDGSTRINAQRFVIATGARAERPAIPGLAEVGCLDRASIATLNELPQELIVLGAEPEGWELAQAFARLGSRVTVLWNSNELLPKEDPETSEALRGILEGDGIEIRTGGDVVRVARRDGRVVCTWRSRGGGADVELTGTHLLAVSGRRANVEDLNLEAVGIHADPEQGIEVDDYLQTRSARIYALGDVIQPSQFAPATERQAEVVFQNAVLRLSKKFNASALPRVLVVDPEVAAVGVTESAARASHPDVLVFHARFDELDRARIAGRPEGFAKVVASPSGKILGATVVGTQASLILQEFVVAMENGLSLGDLAATAHAAPTYGGLVRTIANQFATARREGSLIQSAWKWILGFNRPGPADSNSVDAPAPVVETAGPANGHGHGHVHGH